MGFFFHARAVHVKRIVNETVSLLEVWLAGVYVGIWWCDVSDEMLGLKFLVNGRVVSECVLKRWPGGNEARPLSVQACEVSLGLQ
jgi:hypothetical protein